MTAAELVRGRIGSVEAVTTNLAGRVVAVARRLRGRHLLAVDMVAIVVSIYISLSIHVDGLMAPGDVALYLPTAVLPLIVRPLINERYGLYRRLWGHASVPDLTQILWSLTLGTVICAALFFFVIQPSGLMGSHPIARSFWVTELLLSLALIGGSRFFIRAVNDIGTKTVVDGARVALTPTLLFGAGRAGAMMARSAAREPKAGVKPVGFLDMDPARRGASVAGLHVFGDLDNLGEAIQRTGATMLLITMPNASGSAVREVMDRALELGLKVRTVPGVLELLDGSWDATRVRKVKLADLLTRQQVTTHAEGVEETIRGQVVMVTGAGGSIGSELARQIYGFKPSRLVLVDRAESPLYMIQRELELRQLDGRGDGDLTIHLANVASRAVMTRLIAETKPAVIFHAAACKHVPMMEEHPSEGVQVNIGGTMAVLSASVDAGVPRFVLVSTDKAVEPTSVMGATKRLAEWLVSDAAAKTGRPYVAVRFGNVLGSAGSVLPIFQSQLENGEPITITHPEMSRYFMTIQEAGWLILDAAAIGNPGDLFVLDMGEPVKIVDMVRDLIRLAGRDADSVPIRFTGLRPGEKLHEKLFYESETVQPTDVEKIIRVVNSPPPADIHERVGKLLQIAFGDRDEELRKLLFEAVSVAIDGSSLPVAQAAPPAPVATSGRTSASDGRESAAMAHL